MDSKFCLLPPWNAWKQKKKKKRREKCAAGFSGKMLNPNGHLGYIWNHVCVYISAFSFSFFFLYQRMNSNSHGSYTLCRRYYALFMGPITILFRKKNIKNGSHGTIYTFKNYFAIVFLVFSFNKISSTQTDPKTKIKAGK